jgi:hypothetical protein
VASLTIEASKIVWLDLLHTSIFATNPKKEIVILNEGPEKVTRGEVNVS